MAPFLIGVAEADTPCSHPLCENTVLIGGHVYPARLRPEDVYCSSTCRVKHAKLLSQKARRDHDLINSMDNFKRRERKYGITRKQFNDLYDTQLGRCAVCLTALSEVKVCVDHDHRSKKVRGLLCNPCNQGLGYFKDDPEVLTRAAAYLNQYRTHRVRRVKRKEVTSWELPSTQAHTEPPQVT